MPRAVAFASLGPADRAVLTSWLASPAAGRIETAIDLSSRPWKVHGAHAVIGLFEPGQGTASWLVVGSRTGWTLADCASGSVRAACPTLAQVLALLPP